MDLNDCLRDMGKIYRDDPVAAVRGQHFIAVLHAYLLEQLRGRLTPFATKRGIEVRGEAEILGSHKPKDVDVAVIDPQNGPLMLIGVRSQMSSVGKNVLNYYEGIVGECISLQDRFPMTTTGYVYLHPLQPIKVGREKEVIDHRRYARMYAAITGRTGPAYRDVRGVYDQFAYLVVDFDKKPAALRDDLIKGAVPKVDLSVTTFVDRMVATFQERMLFWDVFN